MYPLVAGPTPLGTSRDRWRPAELGPKGGDKALLVCPLGPGCRELVLDADSLASSTCLGDGAVGLGSGQLSVSETAGGTQVSQGG